MVSRDYACHGILSSQSRIGIYMNLYPSSRFYSCTVPCPWVPSPVRVDFSTITIPRYYSWTAGISPHLVIWLFTILLYVYFIIILILHHKSVPIFLRNGDFQVKPENPHFEFFKFRLCVGLVP